MRLIIATPKKIEYEYHESHSVQILKQKEVVEVLRTIHLVYV